MATVASGMNPQKSAFGKAPTVPMDWNWLKRHRVAMTSMRVKRRLVRWLQTESSRDAWVSLGALGLAGLATLALLAYPLFYV